MSFTEENLEQFNLFSSPTVNTAILKAQYVDIHPTSSIDNASTITFDIKSNHSDYLDLSRTALAVRYKIIQGTGANLPREVGAGDAAAIPNVAPENLILSTMFSNVIVSMGGKTVHNSHHMHGYKSIIECVLLSTASQQ